MKCPYCGGEAGGKFCEFCGSEMPREGTVINITNNYYGETTPRQEQTKASRKADPKKKTWLWVLGWICIFPLPLTILLLRKKDMKQKVKYGIIAVAWLLYLIIGLSGNNEPAPQPSAPPASSAIVQEVQPAQNVGLEISNKKQFA